MYIKGIYIEYVVNIHGISIVYYAHILQQEAGVEKEGRVPFHQRHQQSHPSRLDKSYFLFCWNKELNIIPGIYQVYTRARYIQGIYQMPARGQATESGCRASPEAIYSTTAL